MKVLYLTHSCPYPPNKGDRIRSFNILQHLVSKYDVSLIYPSFNPLDHTYLNTLKQWCLDVKTIPISNTLAKIRCGLNLIKNQPLTNAYFYSPKLQKLVDKEHYDFALVDCSSMAQYLMKVKKPRIIDFVDVDSDKWFKYSKNTKFPKTWVYGREFELLKEFEARLIKEFDSSIVISEEESRCLPFSKRLFVVPNGIDLEYFSPQTALSEYSIIFTGAMNYFPNIDGVLYFTEQIFPLIKRELPGVKFIIGGMNPTPAIRKLASKDIIVTGFVEDMRTYLGNARVCVVPLRIAKGIQNKVLEAMAMKIPVVTTSHVNVGIKANIGKEILVADEAKEFATAVIHLLQDERRRSTMAENARKFVENEFSWKSNLRGLDQAIALALSRHTSALAKTSV